MDAFPENFQRPVILKLLILGLRKLSQKLDMLYYPGKFGGNKAVHNSKISQLSGRCFLRINGL